MLIKKTGNLLDLAENGDFDVIVQGCNCFCVMGSGLACQIKQRYPGAANADARTFRGDFNKLGNCTMFDAGKFLIVNAYTQYNMSKGEDVFEYAAFSLILQKIAHFYPTAIVGLPMIGCGLAGGNKEIIIAIIEDFSEKITSTGGDVTLVNYY